MDWMEMIKAAITAGECIATERTLIACGKISGEISERQAKKLYGTEFVKAVACGDFKPCRVSGKEKIIKYYDTLAWVRYRESHYIKAALLNCIN